jgi:Prolyl oligopeptidase family./Putative lysophospholipase.
MRRPARLIWSILVGSLAILSLDSCASTYFYNVAVARNQKQFLARSDDLGPRKDKKQAAPKAEPQPSGESSSSTPAEESPWSIAWLDRQSVEMVSLVSDDGLRLVGRYIPAAAPTEKTVILAHGYSSQGKYMTAYARFYRDEFGYNVLMPDDRGHGASEGDYIGFGWPDRRDYIKWINWVISKVGPEARIALHGVSMGGATVMMVSGESDLPHNVFAIIEDCGYTSVHDEVSYLLPRLYKINSPRLVADTSAVTKKRAGYDFEEASSLEQVKKDKVPMLFIHGEADTFVPFWMVKPLYEACTAEKELYTVPEAGHGEALSKDRERYIAVVRAFLEKHS